MAESDIVIPVASEDVTPAADVEMGGAEESAENEAPADGEIEPSGLEDIEPEVPERVTFLDHLKSPIIKLVVGDGDDATDLYAHSGLLAQSPYFKAQIESLGTDAETPTIELPGDDLSATASFLEYLYKDEYFPTARGHQLEYDPTVPNSKDDVDGVALLRHARVYTLAQRLGMPALAKLAHKKIHLTQSTARGEVAYARYVYANTDASDESIRGPVAAFWATRSYDLRHEAENEFKTMCLEYPQFGFDVLSLVLDAQEKRTRRAKEESSTGGNPRKRARASQGVVIST